MGSGKPRPPSPVVSRWDVVDGLRMHARTAGDTSAPPIVLLHGFGMSGRYLVPTAVLLAPEYRALVPDLPGFGRSEPVPSGLGIPRLASLLARWLAAIGVERTPVLGNSLGCQIAIELARSRPQLVSALILVSPTVDRDARRLSAQLARIAVDARREPLALLRIAALDYARFVRKGGLALTRLALADQPERRLPEVTQPALVVRGARDPIVPQRWAEHVAARLPRGELRVLAGAAHAVNYTHPQALARLAREFLGAASSSSVSAAAIPAEPPAG